jgi:hypothetical protein
MAAAPDDDEHDDQLAQRFADNESNKAIDALFIVAQHDGCKWADECWYVKDLCRATRAETGLWSAMTRVGYGEGERTLLMHESYRGRLDRVQWLLARGAPRDARNVWGRTALSRASTTVIVHALIAGGADVNIVDYSRATPLLCASRNGHTDIVRALIAGGAGVNSVNYRGQTPLHSARKYGHTDTVLALIAGGADVNIAERWWARGRTPLDVAIHCRHESTTNALIEAGATNGPEADDWSDED